MNRQVARRALGRGCVVLGLLAGGWCGALDARAQATVQDPAQDREAISHATSLSRAFRNAAEAMLPAVVEIRTEVKQRKSAQGERGGRGDNPFKGTPFERFFEDFGGEGFSFDSIPQPRTGLGSGVIIDRAGTILTNNHVVEGADEVIVKLSDGREFTTTEIKTDPRTDLAVLRISGAGALAQARLGDSDKLEIGDWVIAIGNPFGLESTVSAGIISGKGRQLETNERAKFLQTDAAINPGNSGGPLVNLYGEVVGINTAIATSTGTYQGVGFAIPINYARWVMDQLIEKGSVQRAYLGIAIRPLTAELAEAFSIQEKDGALVAEVYPDTPAAEAGFEVGDVVIRLNAQTVHSPSELIELVERAPLGSTQQVTVVRKGQQKTLGVVMKALPEDFGIAQQRRQPGRREPGAAGETYHSEALGFTVANLSPNVAERLGFSGFQGVLVTEVEEASPAAEARLRQGLLVIKVGKRQTAVTNVEEFQEAVKAESLEEGILLLVRNPNGGQDFVLLKSTDR